MSLQFIIGSSGIGKTHYACQRIIRESLETSGKAVLYNCAGAVYHADPEETWWRCIRGKES